LYPNLFRFPDWFPLLGGEYVTTFGLMMFLSFVVGGLFLRSEMERKALEGDRAWDLVFMAVVGGILGAKVYYILLNYPRLVADPAGLIFSRGGMVWYGGFLGATALVLWEVRRSKLPLGPVADSAAPALAIAYAVGRVGCFLVGDDWGRPTTLPWGIRFPEGTPPTTVAVIEREFGIQVDPAMIERYGDVLPVHPTQLYEVGLSTLIFFALWRLRRHPYQAGWLFALWLVLAGLERFLVEFFRAKDDRFFGILTVAQIISLALVAAGVVVFRKLHRAPAPAKRARARA
jgi:phosphatidylglycerol---prolipoprotein diacylglyceryl transferase